MFNTTSNEFTWVAGANSSTNAGTAVAGAYGVEDPSYTPIGRYNSGGGALDDDGNIWIFGGKYSASRFFCSRRPK